MTGYTALIFHVHRPRGVVMARLLTSACWSCLIVMMLPAPLSAATPMADAVTAAEAAEVAVIGQREPFPQARAAVARARESAGRTYRVVVVDSAGGGADAATRLLEDLQARWRLAGTTSGGPAFDPSVDVTIVCDIGDRQLAMRVPWSLEAVAGLDPATLKTELIDKAFVPRAKDDLYDAGLAELIDATEAWVVARRDRDAARADAARRFRTRTVPMSLAGCGGLMVIGALIWQRSRHGRALRQAREKLAAFKQAVMAISDLLDEQQERHRLLPHTDPDFRTPMAGLTQAAYDDVQAAIGRYRERWLALMDIWDRAEEAIGREWPLGTKEAAAAAELIDTAAALPSLPEIAAACRTPLDALENAHERARQRSQEITATAAELSDTIAGIDRGGPLVTQLQRAVVEAAHGCEQARKDLESDPVAAFGCLDLIATGQTALREELERVQSVCRRMRSIREAGAAAAALVRDRRAAGWLLREPGADPDELLTAATAQLGQAETLLDELEVEAADQRLAQAERLTVEVHTLLDAVTAARSRGAELRQTLASRVVTLVNDRKRVELALTDLAEGYADASWIDVADNLTKVDESISRVEKLIGRADHAGDPQRQHHLRALAELEEAERQAAWVEACQRAVLDRRSSLTGLRETLPRRLGSMRQQVSDVQARLQRQRTDRIRANEQAREAGLLVQEAATRFAAERPDLPRVVTALEAADLAAQRATDLADEDDRLARQAASQLEETEALIRRAAAWYAEGVSADVSAAAAELQQAKAAAQSQRYEDSVRRSAEADRLAREAYAAATAEAERRRRYREAERQRRLLTESFQRVAEGLGPLLVHLPSGPVTGPDPWRSIRPGGDAASTNVGGGRTASGGWSRDTIQVGW